MRLDPTQPAIIIIPPPPCPAFGCIPPPGTELVAEEDLGLDDQIEQARMEFDIRMGERNHLRIDYFKLNRFGDVIATEPIRFRRLRLSTPATQIRSQPRLARVVADLHVFAVQGRALRSRRRPWRARHRSSCRNEATGHPQSRRLSTRWLPSPPLRSTRATASRSAGRSPRVARHSSTRTTISLAGCPTSTATSSSAGTRTWRVGIGYTQLRYELELEPDAGDKPAFFDMTVTGPELFFRASF